MARSFKKEILSLISQVLVFLKTLSNQQSGILDITSKLNKRLVDVEKTLQSIDSGVHK